MIPHTLACPDCDDGIMQKIEVGALPCIFKCKSCNSELIISRKTMKILSQTG